MQGTTTILHSLIFLLPLLTTLLLYDFLFFFCCLKTDFFIYCLNSYAFLYFFFPQIPNELVEHYLGKSGFSVS